jgi:hypothetical protein
MMTNNGFSFAWNPNMPVRFGVPLIIAGFLAFDLFLRLHFLMLVLSGRAVTFLTVSREVEWDYHSSLIDPLAEFFSIASSFIFLSTNNRYSCQGVFREPKRK